MRTLVRLIAGAIRTARAPAGSGARMRLSPSLPSQSTPAGQVPACRARRESLQGDSTPSSLRVTVRHVCTRHRLMIGAATDLWL